MTTTAPAARTTPVVVTAPADSLIRRHARYRVKRPVILRRADLVPGDRFGNALFEGLNRTHSKFWHDQRGTGIGGSDVAAIIGVSKYASAVSLFNERTGAVKKWDAKRNANEKLWGTKLERVMLETYAAFHPEVIVFTWPEGWGASFRHYARGYQLASPDAITYNPTTGEWGILELKTSRSEEDWTDYETMQPRVPLYYETQDQWYLDTFNWTDSVVVALFAGSNYAEFPVSSNPFEQNSNRRKVEEFMQHLEDQTPPDWDGSEATYESTRRVHPDIIRETPTHESRTYLDVDLSNRLIDSQRDLKRATDAHRQAKSEVMGKMGKTQHAYSLGEVRIASRQAASTGTPFLKMKVE